MSNDLCAGCAKRDITVARDLVARQGDLDKGLADSDDAFLCVPTFGTPGALFPLRRRSSPCQWRSVLNHKLARGRR